MPLGRQSWRGQPGNWSGAGVGSSIDFQDHRAYAPGDDPRYIHWSAYARTGQLTMKLYRAEVSPLVDVAVDVSASMSFTAEKAARMEALVAFCVESADRAGAPVRVHAVSGRVVKAVPVEAVRGGDWRERLGPLTSPIAPPGPLLWRTHALKVLISDLLFPGDPGTVLVPLAAGGGHAVVLVPALAAEAEVPSMGNLELVDCESGARRHQRIDEALAERYRTAYARHFSLWSDAARRRGVTFARVACEGELATVFGGEARLNGAVEING
ncbi:MAG: DUF58 domain-containing protein [Opitutaceae bacterium]